MTKSINAGKEILSVDGFNFILSIVKNDEEEIGDDFDEAPDDEVVDDVNIEIVRAKPSADNEHNLIGTAIAQRIDGMAGGGDLFDYMDGYSGDLYELYEVIKYSGSRKLISKTFRSAFLYIESIEVQKSYLGCGFGKLVLLSIIKEKMPEGLSFAIPGAAGDASRGDFANEFPDQNGLIDIGFKRLPSGDPFLVFEPTDMASKIKKLQAEVKAAYLKKAKAALL